MNVLEIRDLTKEFRPNGWTSRLRRSVSALDHVDLDLRQGEWLGVVGESGSGKTTLARIIVGLETATGGQVRIDGKSITNLSYRQRRKMAHEIQLVFQDATGALNPRRTIADALSEPLRIRRTARRKEINQRVSELLELVGLDATLATRMPQQLSGGQRQRVTIARALALSPRVLLLDEPASALDVSVQAQILNTLLELQAHTDISVLMISHDLALVSSVCDRVAVMYRGSIVETGKPADLINGAEHPYTVDLLDAVPSVERSADEWLGVTRAEFPDTATPPTGCRYRTRCRFADARCEQTTPDLNMTGNEHHVACHHPVRVEAT